MTRSAFFIILSSLSLSSFEIYHFDNIGRFRVPRSRTTRYAGSFVTSAIKGFNTMIGRTRNDNEWMRVYEGDYNC